MDLSRIIHRRMKKGHLMFVYRGEITEKNSLQFLTLLENEMKDDSFGSAGRKRLFMYVLESLQNIVKHAERQEHSGMSVVAYSKTNDGYTITTGNIIEVAHVANLKKRLDELNSLDTGQTKVLYRQLLTTSEFSEKGGAGLGLIEMAVKTGNRLDFDFIPIDNDHSYFILSKAVDSNGIGVHEEGRAEPFDSSAFLELENLMVENGIHLIWSGHVSPDVDDDVLSITETTLTEEDVSSKLRRRIFVIMVELLENIFKYNAGKEAGEKFGMPIAVLRIENGKFVVSTGNLIENMGVRDLKEKIDSINRNDKSGLKELFLESLSRQTIETDSTGNMGLLAVARKSGSRLMYRFEPVNDLYSYYMLAVKVREIAD